MRVALADDAALLREGLARVLADNGVEVAVQVSDADELLAAVDELRPDVAVVDIRMPPTWSTEGLAAAEEIRRRFPDVAVLVLSQYVEPEYALRLLESSDSRTGYLLKERVLDLEQLVDALERVARGETVVDPALAAQLLDRVRDASPLDQLTPREREVLGLIAEGLTDRGIAERLYLTPNTVETHIRHIIAKLDLPATPADNRRVHAVLAYLRSG
ncbi:MAG TPA: response regulator transcription factor [Gaiellaceae bacterium]|nr:response regulator transcription factor [Gaiellaceae bacterium]